MGQQSGQSGGQFGQSSSMGKGMDSFLTDPSKVDALIREGYIQQASVPQTDQQAVRDGQWDGRIEGFELTRHVLQNASNLVEQIGKTQGQTG